MDCANGSSARAEFQIVELAQSIPQEVVQSSVERDRELATRLVATAGAAGLANA